MPNGRPKNGAESRTGSILWWTAQAVALLRVNGSVTASENPDDAQNSTFREPPHASQQTVQGAACNSTEPCDKGTARAGAESANQEPKSEN